MKLKTPLKAMTETSSGEFLTVAARASAAILKMTKKKVHTG
jgi:hypothetical protein